MKEVGNELATRQVSQLFRKYFFPTLLGMISMCLITIADGMFVGHGVGSDGIAAVNIAYPVFMMFSGVGLMIGAGCSVLASIHLSQGNEKAAGVHVTHALIFASVLALIVSVAMLANPSRTAELLGASDNLQPLVIDYLIFFVPCWVFQMWISIGLFVIRIDGSPKVAMLSSLVSAVTNVVLDWLFIFGFGWGIVGASAATATSIVLGSFIAIYYIFFKSTTLRLVPFRQLDGGFRRFIGNIMEQCRVGSSAFWGETTMAVLMFVGNMVFMRYLGDDGVAAFGIGCYYMPFVFMIGNAIAQSVQPIVSFNFGLGLTDRVRQTERISVRTAVVFGLAVMSAFIFAPGFLVHLFIPEYNDAVRYGVEGFPYFGAGLIFFILNITLIGNLQSVKKAGASMTFALLRCFVFLVPLFFLLPLISVPYGIWLAMPASEFLTFLLILLYHRFKR